MIEINENQIIKAIQAAYLLSMPRGIGFLHYKQDDALTDEEASTFYRKEDAVRPVSLDYIKGRAIKFDVFLIDGKYYIAKKWTYHTDHQLNELLRFINS